MVGEYAATGVDAIGMDTGIDIAAVAADGAGAGGAAGQPRSAGAGRGRRGDAAGGRAVLRAMRGRPFIFNLGHGIVPQTPPEHVAALMELCVPDSRRKVAIVLFNLGGPDSPEAIKPFLRNLFLDPAILRVPFFVRPFLARFIARARVAAGDRELCAAGRQVAAAGTDAAAGAGAGSRAAGAGGEVLHRHALLASVQPGAARAVKAWGPDEVVLLPLYPQYLHHHDRQLPERRGGRRRPRPALRARPPLCCYPTDRVSPRRRPRWCAAAYERARAALARGEAAGAVLRARPAGDHRQARRSVSVAGRADGRRRGGAPGA